MTRLNILVLLSASTAAAEISITMPVEDAFVHADLVCGSRIAAVTALSREDAIDATGALTPVDYEVLHTNAWCYKGSIDSGRFAIRVHQVNRAHGRPGGADTYVLGFFKRSEAGLLTPDTVGELNLQFPQLPARSSQAGDGLKRLEEDALSLAKGPDTEQSRDGLEFLLKFRHLDPSLIAALVELGRSPDPDTRLLSIEALLKIKEVPDRRGLLHRFATLLATQADPDVFPGMSEIDSIIEESSIEDFGALKELVKCRYPTIRYLAMDAIRKLRAPRTMSFLVAQLDSPDRNVRYDALITLAEITDKGGDFGPTMATFEKDPAEYVNRWKQWWTEEGARRYAGAH
jgi:hypothetical protein